jgi:hypothetical protein
MDGSSQCRRPYKMTIKLLTTFLAVMLVDLLPLCLSHANASADGDGSGDQSYDAIVGDLTRQVDRPAPSLRARGPAIQSDSFDSVVFHGGVGLAGLAESLTLPDGKQIYVGQRGIQISFGIDLFSPNWLAEGTYRSFAQAENSQVQVGLQEFEMKFLYKDRIAPQIGIRVGGGLSARYMTVIEPAANAVVYTTPSGVGTLGLDCFLNDKLSVGVDVSGRSAMISDTPDKSSVDATMRVDAHF